MRKVFISVLYTFCALPLATLVNCHFCKRIGVGTFKFVIFLLSGSRQCSVCTGSIRSPVDMNTSTAILKYAFQLPKISSDRLTINSSSDASTAKEREAVATSNEKVDDSVKLDNEAGDSDLCRSISSGNIIDASKTLAAPEYTTPGMLLTGFCQSLQSITYHIKVSIEDKLEEKKDDEEEDEDEFEEVEDDSEPDSEDDFPEFTGYVKTFNDFIENHHIRIFIQGPTSRTRSSSYRWKARKAYATEVICRFTTTTSILNTEVLLQRSFSIIMMLILAFSIRTDFFVEKSAFCGILNLSRCDSKCIARHTQFNRSITGLMEAVTKSHYILLHFIDLQQLPIACYLHLKLANTSK